MTDLVVFIVGAAFCGFLAYCFAMLYMEILRMERRCK